MGKSHGEEICEALTRAVPLMRKLGVTSAFGITLGPVPVEDDDGLAAKIDAEGQRFLDEDAQREEADKQRHLRFWRRVVRGSQADIPVCSAKCACRK